ncbi:ATP-dependent DNA ligase [Agromyces neolithicus]|uniref:ATP-dependent DNA ligase n=1 Tax=Agromyces neolithicus TaxID=269420 RepID=UPI0031D62CD8
MTSFALSSTTSPVAAPPRLLSNLGANSGQFSCRRRVFARGASTSGAPRFRRCRPRLVWRDNSQCICADCVKSWTVALPESLHIPPELALARRVEELPEPDALPGGCLYSPKWDGFRFAIVLAGELASVWSRQGKNLTRYFPELAAAAAELPDGTVLDGEAVIWREGRLDFAAMQHRLSGGAAIAARRARELPSSFAAFDVLAVAGTDVRHLALEHRQSLLEELAAQWQPPMNISPVTRDVDEAREWFETMPAVGVEGIIVKAAASGYEGGKREW